MAKYFGKNEHDTGSLFVKEAEFEYGDNTYKVMEDACKPTCGKGEPKTDIYFRAQDMETSEICEFKLSYKQCNADFLENKTNAERAKLILGDNWSEIITTSTLSLKDNFEARPLIFKDKYSHTNAGSITLGWKFELLRVKSGELSDKMDLSYDQKVDVYAGTNLPEDKKDAYINTEKISESGIANLIYEDFGNAHTAADIAKDFKTIPEYLEDYPDIYYACKALNYRSLEKKYDGNRPLAVYVDWYENENKLDHRIVFDEPLVHGGNDVFKRLEFALNKLNIKDTNDLNENNVVNYDNIVYEKK